MHVIRYQIYIKQGESQTMYITSICHQEWYQMCLLFGENFDEVVKISHTSASQQLSQLVVAVTWLYNVDKVYSLRPRDTACISKINDKCKVRVNEIQQLNTIDSQLPHPSFIQRSNITEISCDICTLMKLNTIINCFNLLNLPRIMLMHTGSRHLPIPKRPHDASHYASHYLEFLPRDAYA